MKYIIKDGAFLNKEDGSTTSALKGKLAGIRAVTSDSGAESIQFDLAGTDGEGNAVTHTISVRKYGDSSLKILRCLYGIADIIAGKEIEVRIEPREGRSALIVVTADGELLTPAGSCPEYTVEKKALTDRMLSALRTTFGFRLALTVFANKDGYIPTAGGEFDAEAAAEYIRELRSAGRGDEIVCKKTVFTSAKAADGYAQAFADLAGKGRCAILPEGDDADLLMEAYTEDIPTGDDLDEHGREREY